MSTQERSEANHIDTSFTLHSFPGLVGDKELSEVDASDLDIFMNAPTH